MDLDPHDFFDGDVGYALLNATMAVQQLDQRCEDQRKALEPAKKLLQLIDDDRMNACLKQLPGFQLQVMDAAGQLLMRLGGRDFLAE